MAKKLLTFLGTGDYKTVVYFQEESNLEEQYQSLKSKYVQESLAYILEDVEVCTCITEASKHKHWEPKDETVGIGLKKIFENRNIKYREIEILDGKNTDEMWENFDKIYSYLNEGDEVYVDITHSFRSIPILMMAVLNYAKETKNVTIKAVYYGAYEARKTETIAGVEMEIAPILDLTLFNKIQDWAKGAEKFLTAGDSRSLVEEIDKELLPIVKDINHESVEEGRKLKKITPKLKKYTENILSCRGQDISKDTLELKKLLESHKEVTIKELTPLIKIMDKVYGEVEAYSGDVILDSITTIEKCLKYGLLQQAYTFLQETIISYITIKLNKDYKNKDDREIARIMLMKNKQEGKVINVESLSIEYLANLYSNSGDYRNDINHCGFRQDAHKYNDFQVKLQQYIKELKYYINNDKNVYIKEEKDKSAVILLSHSLFPEQIEELKEKWKVKNIIRLEEDINKFWSNIVPFGDIDAEMIERIEKSILKNTEEGDYVIVQGEFGATYQIVKKSLDKKRIPLYSTTERIVEEVNKDGYSYTKRTFKHVQFRKYSK